MTYLTLIHDPNTCVASNQLVIPAAELTTAQNAIDLGDKLESLLSEEQSRIDSAVRDGYQDGFQRGKEEGFQHKLDELSGRLSELTVLIDQRHCDLQDSVARIAIQVVRKIAAEVGAREMVFSLAETAAKELVPGETLVVEVSPGMQDEVAEHLASPASKTTRHTYLEVRVNHNLEPFDCVLKTEHGSVIAGLNAQLENLETILAAGHIEAAEEMAP